MITFLDATTYYFALVFFIIIFSLLVIFKKSVLLIYQWQIAVILALIQISILLSNTIITMLDQTWWGLLMHDLCPMASFASMIIFLINRNSLYKMIMPWLLLGATITILGGDAPFYSDPEYLMTFFEHMTMLCQGCLAYLWVKKYQKKDFWLVLILPIFIIFWNFLTGFLPWKLTGETMWVHSSTALFLPSLGPGTNFEIIGLITFMPYPLPTILFYLLSLSIVYLICLNKNYFPSCYSKFKKIIFKTYQ